MTVVVLVVRWKDGGGAIVEGDCDCRDRNDGEFATEEWW